MNELQDLTQVEEMFFACALVNKVIQGILSTCHKMLQNLQHLSQDNPKIGCDYC
jgi:hypothetical protein